MSDLSNELSSQIDDLIIEPCLEIYEVEEAGARLGFNGLIKDAPRNVSTAIVNALSQQLIYQINLIVPDALVSCDDLNIKLGEAAFPFVQPAAKVALQKAIQERGEPMQINSGYRTIAQQMLLFNWRGSNSNPVAPPGRSNHQSGLALDIQDRARWVPFLKRYGWQPLEGDPPHIDFKGGGTKDLRKATILAFQQLWNKNHQNEKITEDGDWGLNTEKALNRSPSMGFDKAPWDDKPRVLRLSRPLMEGSDVGKLQEKLKAAGFAISVADGVFGNGTDKAVKEFQKQKGLVVDGIVGSETLKQIALV
jgi:hypothetical protein